VLHHENWHFLRVAAKTHFAKAHLCLMEGMLDHFKTKNEYKNFIKTCRDSAGVGEESDLKTFFVPGDGGRAGEHLQGGLRDSTFIGINAHRFSFKLIRTELENRLASPRPPEVQLTVDDDIWWAGHGEKNVPNTEDEFEIVQPLAKAGVKVRYLETNQGNGLLHHNKFMVFKSPRGESVFTGAGNFTGTAFTDNFENFYFITIPHVVKAMAEQQKHLFELGTPEENLPKTNVTPKTN
jgi:phosphatidylserine/phosphatidylglycerophosphate/cardiolipin synthase-like enzyme